MKHYTAAEMRKAFVAGWKEARAVCGDAPDGDIAEAEALRRFPDKEKV